MSKIVWKLAETRHEIQVTAYKTSGGYLIKIFSPFLEIWFAIILKDEWQRQHSHQRHDSNQRFSLKWQKRKLLHESDTNGQHCCWCCFKEWYNWRAWIQLIRSCHWEKTFKDYLKICIKTVLVLGYSLSDQLMLGLTYTRIRCGVSISQYPLRLAWVIAVQVLGNWIWRHNNALLVSCVSV